MYVKLVDIQKEAAKNRYAIPFVLGGNLEMACGAIEAAEECGSPIGLGVAPEVFSKIPVDYVFPMLIEMAKRSKVPTAVHLDHGKSIEQIKHVIGLGVNSVMFDGSYLPYEENVKRTKEIVDYAHARGVCVEAELGYVGGSAVRIDHPVPEGRKTDPETVVDFVEKTKVDSLAISFGNVHGIYRGKSEIDLELVKKIVAITDTPLVMHGGSGLKDEIYPAIVEAGISNIHFYSATVREVWGYLHDRVGADDKEPPYHELSGYMQEYFREKTKYLIRLLGSAGRVDGK